MVVMPQPAGMSWCKFPRKETLRQGFENKWFIWEAVPENTAKGRADVSWGREGSH